MRQKIGDAFIAKIIRSLTRQQALFFQQIGNLELTQIQSRTLEIFRKMDIDNNGYISEENFLRKIEITCFPSAIAIAQLDHQGGIFMIGKLGA